ncbi:MAG TPA: hypothetical protein VMW08_01080, partial [Acidimicrobiales bacterium]|nr:hypothetical protein [Acidimicrobiales bacterium]
AIVGLFSVSVASVVGLYETPSELRSYADLALADPAIKAFAGPGNGLENPTQGAVVMNETMLYSYVAIALMCIFLMVRHTRAEEETDRAELVRAAPVGRHATLTAAVFWVAAIDLVVAVGLIIGLLAFGLGVGGSVAFGAAAGGVGLVFVGVAAITAQTASSARAATAGASTVLGAAFLLRAVGDLGTSWLSWLSPLGWAQSISAFAGERWWVLALLYPTAAGLIASALVMSGRRDLGAGVRQQRPGPARASHRLASPLALAARLSRTSVIGWAVGVGILAFFMGIIANQADKFLEDETMAEFFALAGVGSPAELFLATAMVMNGVLVAGFTVSSVLRLRTEELEGRAEPVLATPVSRQRWMLSQLAVAGGGTVTVVMCSGLLLGLGYAVRVGDWGEVLPVLVAAVVMVPPLMVLAGFTVALIGVSPRWSIIAWVGVVYASVVAFLAESLNLPTWVRNLSPFQHVPAVPAQSFEVLPLALLLGMAAAFTLFGMVALARRDVT